MQLCGADAVGGKGLLYTTVIVENDGRMRGLARLKGTFVYCRSTYRLTPPLLTAGTLPNLYQPQCFILTYEHELHSHRRIRFPFGL